MKTLTAHVRGGRLLLDEPTDFPEGTSIPLTIADSDDLDDEDRQELHAFLEESLADEGADVEVDPDHLDQLFR